MNILSSILLQSLFNSTLPRLVIKAEMPRLTILSCNDAFHTITQIEERNTIGRSLLDMQLIRDVEGNGSASLLKAVIRAIENRQSITTPYYEIIPVGLDDYEQACLLITFFKNIQRKTVYSSEQAKQAMDDELHEELATINEELVATNEELINTVEELKDAQNALLDLNNDLESRVMQRTDELLDAKLLIEQQFRRLSSIISQIPIGLAILSGENMVLELVNEHMLKIWDREVSVTGRPLLDFMPEIRNQSFPNILKEVFFSGNAYQSKDAKVEIFVNERLQTRYMDYSYTPLRNQNNEIDSILVLAEDVTQRTLDHKYVQKLSEDLSLINEELVATNEELNESQQHLLSANESLIESEERFRLMVQQAPVAISILKGPDLIVESANDTILALWGKTINILGRPLSQALPEIQGQPFLDLLDKVFQTGETAYGNEAEALLEHHGQLVKCYFNFIYKATRDEHNNPTGVMIVATEVSDQVKARHVLEKSEERFRFMLNAMPQQVWTAKPNGQIDYVNQVIANDFGKNTESIISSGWDPFIHPEDVNGTMQKWIASLEHGTDFQVEFRLLFRDGAYRWHLARAVPLIEDGEIKFWLGTNTNIDAQKANEQKKDEFLSIASHELKTPLTTIKAFNQLMKRNKDSDKLAEFLDKSSNHIHRLEKLINDLLDVTKINAGKMIYAMEPFNFQQMLQESIESVQHNTSSHTIIQESKADIIFTGDHYRLEQVMNNFLTNSIKYSPNGKKIIVNSKVEHGNIIVSVQDFGIGIAEESLDRLFERYYRVDNSSMHFEGLGLGLFISSEILKRHHGDFWIESEPGKGSTFFFRLPLSKENEEKKVVNTGRFYQDDTITISYNEKFQRLETDWTGFQNLESVKAGCMTMLDLLARNKCSKVVNDNRHVLGTWSEAADWVGQDWFPMMERAGLKYFAWIYSPSAFSQLSAKKSVDVAIGGVKTQLFTDIVLAESWINEQP